MAIIQKTQTSKTILDEKQFAQSAQSPTLTHKKRKGFLRSTFAELKLVRWPSLRYTLNWSITVVVFALLLTVFVGGLDKLFKGGFEYVTCTAQHYKGTGGSNLEQCGKQLGKSLVTF